MLVTKAMCVVMKLPAILVATWKWHVCADVLKPVSFELDHLQLEIVHLGFLVGKTSTKQFEPLRYLSTCLLAMAKGEQSHRGLA